MRLKLLRRRTLTVYYKHIVNGSMQREDVKLFALLFGRIRARRIINRGFSYRDGNRRIWIPTHRIVQVELE